MGILADNLFDFIMGFMTVWFLYYGNKVMPSVGVGLFVFYVLGVVGQFLETEYVSVGYFVHIFFYIAGGIISCFFVLYGKKKKNRVEENKISESD